MSQNNSAAKQKEWYKKWWGIIIALIFLIPFGLWYIWFKAAWSKKVKIAATAGLVILVIIGFSSVSSRPYQQLTNKPTSTQVEPKKADNTKSNKNTTLGDEAYLKYPETDDPEQIIPLAYDKGDYNALLKAVIAKDAQGIHELGAQGKTFGVSNGSKVLVIDSAVGLKKVRILKGVRPIDDNKIGLAGWAAYEFVVK